MITQNETKLLVAIRDNQFHDGRHPVGNYVWVDCVCEVFNNSRVGSGVMSSLVKKGLAKSDGISCTITQAGFDLLLKETCV